MGADPIAPVVVPRDWVHFCVVAPAAVPRVECMSERAGEGRGIRGAQALHLTLRGSRDVRFSAARRAQFAPVRRFPRARRKALRLLPRLPPSDGWPRKIQLLQSARPPAISPS